MNISIATCKKSIHYFIKGKNYKVSGIYSIFENDDFISLENDGNIFRFRLNKSTDYIDNYVGESEFYFYDYFSSITEERKIKIEEIENMPD